MSQQTIKLESVSKRFGKLTAVDKVSFSVAESEILVLLGPSGCGKTTTLRLIAGLEEPDDGKLWMDGRQVAGHGGFVPPEQRRIGMVFQDYALFPHLTLKANVGFALNRLSTKERDARVHEMLELVGLTHAGERYPHQISGGQQQRVALARALASNPSVVLLDEPFSNLDAALRKEMREELRRILRTAGTTAVFVTHDQQEALSLSDRVAVIFDGKLAQIDTPQMIYERPVNRQVGSFVGEANIVSGEASGDVADSPLGTVRLNDRHSGAVDLLIRPEMIDVRKETKGTAGTDAGAQAVVQWREYFGYEQRLGLRLPDESEIIARMNPRQIVDIGDTISLRVDEAVQAFAV